MPKSSRVLGLAVRCLPPASIAIVCCLLAAVGSGILPAPAAADCVEYTDAIHWLGDIDIPENAQRVDVSGDYAYVTANAAGLVVVDVSDPRHPIVAGSVDTPGNCVGIEVRDGYAYVAAEGLQVIDVSDPAAPQLAAIGGSAYSYDVALSGNFAYMAASWMGLQIIDISDPLHPAPVAALRLQDDAHAIAVNAGIAYVADGYAGLTLVDVSDPHAPAILASVDIPGNAMGVAAQDGYAYLTGEYPGLDVIDVTDPRHPFVAAELLAYSLGFEDIEVSGERAYVVADALPGLVAVDISDPLHPAIAGTSGANSIASGVTISGTLAFLTDEYSHLQVIDVTHPDSPPVVGAVAIPGDGGAGYAISDTELYSACFEQGLVVVDVSEPSNPQVIGQVGTPYWAVDVALFGSLVCVACADSGLTVIDVSVPQTPRIVTRVRNVGLVWAVAADSRYVYLGDMAGYLRVLDFAFKPPRTIGSVAIPSGPISITISGTLAFVAADLWGLQVIDIADPAHPQRIASLDTEDEARDIALLEAGKLCIADCRAGVGFVDVSDPYHPVQIAGIDIPGQVHSVAVRGGHVYATSYDTGLWAIDADDPHDPLLLGCVNTEGDAGEVVLSNEYAFVADLGKGLKILPLQCAASGDVPWPSLSRSGRMQAYPNPASTDVMIEVAASTAAAAPDLGIYDPSGRLIRSLVGTRWDRRDDRGKPVPAGLYLIRDRNVRIGCARVLVVR